MIKNLSIQERFEGDNQYQCDKCGKSDASRQASILKLPPYLIITINRFKINYETMSRDKICTDVEIEEVINFSKIFESLKKNEKAQKDYHLYG
jgi:ubiquitin C-terminal hydrolase